jgi:hypothetical protein
MLKYENISRSPTHPSFSPNPHSMHPSLCNPRGWPLSEAPHLTGKSTLWPSLIDRRIVTQAARSLSRQVKHFFACHASRLSAPRTSCRLIMGNSDCVYEHERRRCGYDAAAIAILCLWLFSADLDCFLCSSLAPIVAFEASNEQPHPSSFFTTTVHHGRRPGDQGHHRP